jgi:hypothetical protein
MDFQMTPNVEILKWCIYTKASQCKEFIFLLYTDHVIKTLTHKLASVRYFIPGTTKYFPTNSARRCSEEYICHRGRNPRPILAIYI